MKTIILRLISVLCLQALVTQLGYANSYRSPIERTGDTIQILIPTAGLAATLLYEDPKIAHYEGTVQWVKAFATFQVTTEILKVVTHKERPNGHSFKSFPSGHTAAAFMGATFIHKRYGIRYAVPAYIGAAYVGYSRIYANKHYGEDVLSGAAIGMASSAIFTRCYKGVHISPMIAPKTVGVAFNMEW